MATPPPERWLSWGFMAEIEDGQPASDGYVHYRHVDSAMAEIVLRPDAWEKLGRPLTLEVTVEPYDNDSFANPS